MLRSNPPKKKQASRAPTNARLFYYISASSNLLDFGKPTKKNSIKTKEK